VGKTDGRGAADLHRAAPLGGLSRAILVVKADQRPAKTLG
jgi:hypothetical protein